MNTTWSSATQSLLDAAVTTGVLTRGAVLLSARLCRISGEDDPAVILAGALAVTATEGGSVAVDLRAAHSLLPAELITITDTLASPDTWVLRVRSSPVTTGSQPAFALEGALFYLVQYHRLEGQVADGLAARILDAGQTIASEILLTTVEGGDLETRLDRYFPGDTWQDQRAAARHALTSEISILTGGPGSGKTTTVSRLLALLLEQQPGIHIDLAAPTGKAAARMAEAIELSLFNAPADDVPEQVRSQLLEMRATTLHRLLGLRPDDPHAGRGTDRPLPSDVVIVDETSMVPMSIFARLLRALRPDARLILVGDADQLQSVEAGNLLADIDAGLSATTLAGSVVNRLTSSRRFAGEITTLAAAIREADPDAVLGTLVPTPAEADRTPPPTPVAHTWRGTPDDVGPRVLPAFTDLLDAITSQGASIDSAELAELLGRQRILCAHREGPSGAIWWNQHITRLLAERTSLTWHLGHHIGQPVVVTQNDLTLGVYNGDSGVVLSKQGIATVRILHGERPHDVPLARMGHLLAGYASTVHRAQGSQAESITVILPDSSSSLLTRELLYTAVTRAVRDVMVVGEPATIVTAVERRSIRTSGLAQRLTSALDQGSVTAPVQ